MPDYDLANKYRPAVFEDVIGNDATVQAIKTVLSRPSGIPHAWLLHGPSGCGKTTLARIIASALKCGALDYHEYDLGSEGGVDTIRKILEQLAFAPRQGSSKVYVLDECHMLTTQAQNALLKELEEPPVHVFFFLCTTDPKKLIPTVRSRCQSATFAVEAPRKQDVYKLLDKICQAEGADPLPAVLKEAIYTAGGGCRDILGMLDRVIDVVDDEQALQLINSTALIEATVNDLCSLIVSRPTLKAVLPILKSLKEQKQDPEGIRRAILAWLTNAALGKSDPRRCEAAIGLFSNNYYDVGFAGLVRDCISVCAD